MFGRAKAGELSTELAQAFTNEFPYVQLPNVCALPVEPPVFLKMRLPPATKAP